MAAFYSRLRLTVTVGAVNTCPTRIRSYRHIHACSKVFQRSRSLYSGCRCFASLCCLCSRSRWRIILRAAYSSVCSFSIREVSCLALRSIPREGFFCKTSSKCCSAAFSCAVRIWRTERRNGVTPQLGLHRFFVQNTIKGFGSLFTPPSSPELPERGRTVPVIRASGWRNHRPAHPAHGAARLHSAAFFPPDSGSSAPNGP